MPFAPVVAIDPATPAPKAPSALVATVTQAAGESAIKSLAVTFPPAFGFNERFRPPRCQPEEEAVEMCPAASQIGTVSAVSSFGPAAGEVYIADDFRVLIFAEAFNGLVKLKSVGTVTAGADNSLRIEFTGLPDLPLERLVLDLDGGDLALIKLPDRCGRHALPASFVSHEDETATAEAVIDVAGCTPPPLRVRDVSADSGTLRWTVTPAVRATRVVVSRGGERVAAKRVTQPRASFRLEPGRYRAKLTPLAGERRGPTAAFSFTV